MEIKKILQDIADWNLGNCFVSPNESDSNGEEANIVDAIFAMSRSLREIAHSIDRLGLNNADTKLGAIEVLSKEIREMGIYVKQSGEYLKDQGVTVRKEEN